MFLLRLPIFLLLFITQSAQLALSQIWANKVRATLTTIGIVIGIASVTAVIAALTGLRTNVLAEFESFGTNKIFIFPQRPAGAQRNISWHLLRFQPEHFDGLLEHCPSVAHFTRITDFSRPVSAAGRGEETVQITGIEPGWHKVESRSVVQGRPFSLVDNERGLPVCLINIKLRDKLLLPTECIGESILIAGRRFRIVGIIETRTESSMFGGGGGGVEVFVPFTTARRMQPNGFMMAIAAGRSPEVSEEARAEISFFLRRARRIPIGQPSNFGIEAVESYVQKFRDISATMTMIAAGVVGISLLVGGVGIMNIMLVSVSERTREIGLRKAVGARPSAIMLQFLIEAIMLCMFGGLLGVLGGQGLTSLMASLPGAQLGKAHIPVWAVILAFGFSATVGVVFGMFPAIKAARLNPIDALRHE